jgi:hypothetical protein
LAAAGGGTPADLVAGGIWAVGGMAAAGYVAADGPGLPVDTFHDEVLRTTADLDAILALAGVPGANVGARPAGCPDGYVVPEVPDTPEGVEWPGGVSAAAAVRGAGPNGADSSVDDESIIAGRRLI